METPIGNSQDASPADSRSGARNAVRHHVLGQIRSGKWTVGEKLPTEVSLAGLFETSRSNVNKALKALEEQGIVRRYRRKGTFVARAPSASDAPSVTKAAKPRTRRVHVVTPINQNNDAMLQWKHAALCQIETSLNQAGAQVASIAIPDHPTPDEISQVVKQAEGEGAQGIILLTDLLPSKHDVTASREKLLLPYTRALLGYAGRICWLNHAGAPLIGWPYDAVNLAPFDEGLAVGQYLRQQGVSKVICPARHDTEWSRMRVAGIEMAIEHAPKPINMHVEWFDGTVGYDEAFDKVLDQISDSDEHCLPTIVPPHDMYAARFLDAAKARGMKCPEQFCLIAFGNDERFRNYNITTVAPPATQLGELMSLMITDQIPRPANASVHMTLKSIIVERLSFMMNNEDMD